MTDRELSKELNFVDPNKVRPRRNELSKTEKTKDGMFVRDAVLIEDTKRPCEVTGKLCIAWKLNNETLNAYMER